MYCKKCGTQNDDNAVNCTNCGEQLKAATAQTMEKIPNHLVWAILTTILCCAPLGIVAIVFSAQVNTKLAAGDAEGARKSSGKVKMWCWIALGTGLVIEIVLIILSLFMVTKGASIFS